MSNTYGCVQNTGGMANCDGHYFDVSKSLIGAKRWATRNKLTEVYCRWNNGYTVTLVAVKVNGKWAKHIVHGGSIEA